VSQQGALIHVEQVSGDIDRAGVDREQHAAGAALHRPELEGVLAGFGSEGALAFRIDATRLA